MHLETSAAHLGPSQQSSKFPVIFLAAGILFSLFAYFLSSGFSISDEPLLLTLGKASTAGICAYCAMAFFALMQASSLKRAQVRENGAIFGLSLFSTLVFLALCTTGDIVSFAVLGACWAVIFASLAAFRSKDTSSSEGAAKLFHGASFWFLLMCLAAIFAVISVGNTEVSSLMHLSAQDDLVARLATSLLLVAMLSFMGAPPFFMLFVDALEAMPPLVATLFLGGSLISGSLFVSQLLAGAGSQGLSGATYVLIIVFAFISLIVAPLRAIDQRRISKMVIYLFLTLPGIFLLIGMQVGGTKEPSEALVPVFVLLSLAIPSALGGVAFFKHKKSLEPTWEEFAGAGRKHPVIASAWIYTLASLAGIPGTMGFAIRLEILRSCSTDQILLIAAFVWLSVVLASLAVIRLGIFLFAKPTTYHLSKHHEPERAFWIVMLSVALFVISVFPNIVLDLFL